MRIAFFSETFLPKVDGIVIVLCHLLDHLAQEGHESLLFAPKGSPDVYANTPVRGVSGLPFPLYPELTLASPLAGVVGPLKAFQPDVIHLVNPTSLGLAGLRAARRLNVPTVASYHTDVPGFATRMGYGFASGPLWAYYRWVHNQVDLNCVPSSVTQRELQAHGFRRVKVWTHGVDASLFHPGKRSAALRWRLSGGQPEQPLLLFVGRLAAEKRIDWLLPVLQAHPQVRLAVVGDGPARQKLEQRFAGTQTVFTGYMRGEELAAAYASSDIFVFPGANETFGNVVAEAMASGLAVIVPDSGGVLDFSRDGENCLWFASEAQDSLLDAVERLLANPELRFALSAAARATAEKRDWHSINAGLVQDYEHLAKRQPVQFLLASGGDA